MPPTRAQQDDFFEKLKPKNIAAVQRCGYSVVDGIYQLDEHRAAGDRGWCFFHMQVWRWYCCCGLEACCASFIVKTIQTRWVPPTISPAAAHRTLRRRASEHPRKVRTVPVDLE